jgi:hypothetical protein
LSRKAGTPLKLIDEHTAQTSDSTDYYQQSIMRFVTDNREAPRASAKMQALSLGLSRCATSSLQAALESDVIDLAPCLHMAHVGPHADRLQLVLDAMALPEHSPERLKILHKLFDNYRSTCDFPGWQFAPELMDMYPDAPVVLNQRQSARAWADSSSGSHSFFGNPLYLWTCYLWKTDRLHYRIHRRAYEIAEERFGTENLFTAEFYEAHNGWVRREAAKRGRPVLEWTPADGWGPLCEFLGKEAPKDGRPFPHLNDAAAMDTVKRILVARGLITWALLGAAGWTAYRYLLG